MSNKIPKYDFDDSQAEKIVKDNSKPLWWRILNLDAKNFDISKTAGLNSVNARIKDLNILRQLAPRTYEACAEEVKEFNSYNAFDGRKFRKVVLGKKLGSIPMVEWSHRPELQYDEKAVDKYFIENPQFKCK